MRRLAACAAALAMAGPGLSVTPAAWGEASPVGSGALRGPWLASLGEAGGPTNALALRGQLAFAGVGTRVVALDLADPEAPRQEAASAPLPGLVVDMVIRGDDLFVVTTSTSEPWTGVPVASNSLVILDARPGGQLAIVAQHAGFPAEARLTSLAVDGSRAFVGAVMADARALRGAAPAGGGGSVGALYAVDVSRLDAPRPAWSLALPEVRDVTAGAGHVYAASGAGLTVVNADGSGQTWVEELSDVALAVELDGPRLQVLIPGALVTLDAEVFPAVHLLGFAIVESASALAVQGDRAYVGSFDGLFVVEVGVVEHSPPGAAVPGLARAVAVSGGLVVVALGGGGLAVVDVAEAEAPFVASTYVAGGFPVGAALVDSRLYLCAGGTGLVVVDVADPASPSVLGAYAAPGATALAVSGAHAFVAAGEQGLRIIDVADPAWPREVGAVSTGGAARDVAVSGERAFVAVVGVDGAPVVLIVDVSIVAAPRLLGTYRAAGAGTLVSIAVDGPRLYVLSDDALQIVDAADPAHPRLLGAYFPPREGTSGTRFTVGGGYAYVSAGAAGVRIVDLAEPANPVEVGVYPTTAFVEGIVVHDEVAYMALADLVPATARRLEVVALSDPAAPRLLARTGGARRSSNLVPGIDGIARDGDRLAWLDPDYGVTLVAVKEGPRLYLPGLAGAGAELRASGAAGPQRQSRSQP